MEINYTERAQKCREMVFALRAALPSDEETKEAAMMLEAEFLERLLGISIAPFDQQWRQDTFFRAWEDYVEALQDLAEGIEVEKPAVRMP